MFRILLLFISLMTFSSLQSQVYILEFVNPSQNASSLTWTAQIRAISGSFIMGASNIRYNFNNSGLNPNSNPTFAPASGFQLDVTGFVGSAPNRVAVVSFSPTSSSGITVTTSPTVIGTITHNKLSNLPTGTLANVIIREWNVPGYTSNLPLPTPNQLFNCTLIYDASGDENIYQAGMPVNLDPNISLPINLKTFSAEKAGERMSKLYWISASEVNASHFEVERSFDAMQFDKMGDVAAIGNSTTESYYEFYDKKIPSVRTNTIIYYRLKLVDLDGTYKYSDIRGVNFSNDQLNGVTMYPNPTSQWVNLDINASEFVEESGNVQIFDSVGKLVFTKKVIGKGIETIDLGSWNNGVYHVILTQGDKMFREKIVKID